MAAEGKIRKALKERVEAYGGEIRAVSWLGRRHAPDVLCLFPSVAYYHWVFASPTNNPSPHPFAETKAPDGKPTAAQAREHERMRDAGCTVLVISTIAQLDDWLPPL
jgi:hypothetical protein